MDGACTQQPLYGLGARQLREDAALRGPWPLCELPRRRRAAGRGQRRLWPQLSSSQGGEGQVRSGELLPHEPEHPAHGLSVEAGMGIAAPMVLWRREIFAIGPKTSLAIQDSCNPE